MRGRGDNINISQITDALGEIEIAVLTALRDSVFGDLTADGIRDNAGIVRRDMRLKPLVQSGQIEKIESDGITFYRIAPPGLDRLQKIGQ